MAGHSQVSGWQKATTLAFLVVFLSFGFSGAEQWPLTSWHLFSGIRTRNVQIWQATTIDASGQEALIAFSTFGVRYAGWYSRLLSFPRLPSDRQIAECEAWAAEVRARTGADVRAVVVYRGDHDGGARIGDRAAPPAWRVAFRCEHGSVEALP